MALADILTARAAAARATASVDCGVLGAVTVEALPLRELERFSSGPDGDRGLFYAACRELQLAGEDLFKAGKLVQPDSVTAFLSDSEARLAADTVRSLSGWTAVTQVEDASERTGSALGWESEVRLSSVQENSSEQDAEAEIRPETVREDERDFSEVRQDIVQQIAGQRAGGQVSREFSEKDSKNLPFPEISDKTQKILSVNGFRPQDMWDRAEETLHETEPEYKADLHEVKSESVEKPQLNLHETESDFGTGVHEIKSDLSKGLHETESESAEKPRMDLHETELESAERIARQILEGLRQAAWVR